MYILVRKSSLLDCTHVIYCMVSKSWFKQECHIYFVSKPKWTTFSTDGFLNSNKQTRKFPSFTLRLLPDTYIYALLVRGLGKCPDRIPSRPCAVHVVKRWEGYNECFNCISNIKHFKLQHVVLEFFSQNIILVLVNLMLDNVSESKC